MRLAKIFCSKAHEPGFDSCIDFCTGSDSASTFQSAPIAATAHIPQSDTVELTAQFFKLALAFVSQVRLFHRRDRAKFMPRSEIICLCPNIRIASVWSMQFLQMAQL